jgi:small-conductance mechanosensitive channel
VLLLVGETALVLGGIEVAFHVLLRTRRPWARTFSAALARHCWWPSRLVATAVVAELALPGLRLSPAVQAVVDQVLVILQVAGVAWAVAGISFALEDLALARFRVDVRDNLRARRVHTQVMVIRRLTVVVVTVLAIAVVLTTLTDARVLGASLLASAGIAGVVVGIAARPIISNLLAGVQMLFSEPIRVDDVVVVEGQWGRVEVITFTYVVVRIWDDRRLVLPISYFLERPFESWTRTSAQLLTTVLLPVDYTVPVSEVREELGRILEGCPLWDRRAWNLQVTDAGHGYVERRARMSAPDAPTAWDLRCEVREKLVEYLRRHHPDSLPRTRVAMVGAEGGRTDERRRGDDGHRGAAARGARGGGP